MQSGLQRPIHATWDYTWVIFYQAIKERGLLFQGTLQQKREITAGIRSRSWGNLTFSIFSPYKSFHWGLDKVSPPLSFQPWVLLLSMDVKIQTCTSQRFFMSMSYSPNLTLPPPVFWKVEEDENNRRREGDTLFLQRPPEFVLIYATWLALTPRRKCELFFFFAKRPKPTGLSKQSEDLRVPGIKITADSNWRHTLPLSSNFAASVQKNVAIRKKHLMESRLERQN